MDCSQFYCFKMLIAALIRKTKNEELGADFYMWEKDSDLNNCRDCQAPFGVTKRRHHCRNCGGIFCDSCSLTNVTMNGETCDRCCHGCIRGETPGDNIRGMIEKKIASVLTPIDLRVTVEPISLAYGSQFDVDRKQSSSVSSNGPAPSAGYFEIINKTSSFCCLKLVYGTSGTTEYETLWEIPRPSYYALPPNEIMNCNFRTDLPFLELFILTSNPTPVPEGVNTAALVYNTKSASPTAPIKASTCAQISNFRQFQVYRIRCTEKNVMVKFKDGSLEPRAGNSIARVGVFGKLLGTGNSSPKRSNANNNANAAGGDNNNDEGSSTLDFSTNIPANSIEKIFASNIMIF